MMRILHYIPSIDRAAGGTTFYMQQLSKELGKLVELHVATHKSGDAIPLQNSTLHYVSGTANSFGMQKSWLALLDELHPDVVHVNCCWLPGCALAVLSAKKRGYKVVLTTHGMLEPWIVRRHYWTRKLPALLLYQRRAVRCADCIHATAESERQNLLKLGYNSNIQVIANGIDVDDIVMKQSWKRRREILFLSRIHVKKGINYLFEAVAQLRNELSGYTIRIAGEGDAAYVNELKQQANILGISEMIRFEGGVYGDRKWELYRNADIFVLPTHSENFGIVVAEALACGTPVITTVGTPWQELVTERCGWWTGIGTEAIANSMQNFLNCSEETLAAMGQRGHALVEQRYSVTAIAAAMKILYDDIATME